MLLELLKKWQPFKIDALGIITILGADEMSFAVGKLSRSPCLSYLPLLGAHTVASNSFTRSIPGFFAYNITDRIKALDTAGWFARWLQAQNISSPSTCIKITVSHSHCLNKTSNLAEAASLLLACFVIIPPVIVAVLMNDWYALATYMALITSVIVRKILIKENCMALDTAAETAISSSSTPSAMSKEVKAWWTLPDGTSVTLFAPRGVVINCLLTTPRPKHPNLYNITRTVGWVAFAVNIVTLGNACLLNQLVAVALLLFPTWLMAMNVLADDTHVGSRLQFEIKHPPKPYYHAAALARLKLSPEEEEAMVSWGLYPLKSNSLWWERFERAKQEPGVDGFKHWGRRLAKVMEKQQ
jgi:hypothetical protein